MIKVKKQKKLPTKKQLLARIEQCKKYYKNTMSDRILLHETYDDNFEKIQKSEKQSREHLKLLVIENALNEQSVKLVILTDEVPARIKRIREKIVEKKYRLEAQ